MPLSEHEQRLLDQLEKQLNADDPHFATSMSSNQSAKPSQMTFGARNIVIGVLIFLLGLGAVITAVSTKIILLGVLGFVIALAGIYFAVMPASPSKNKWSAGDGRPDSHKGSSKQKSSFIQGLESKWDERRFGGN